MPIGTPRDRPRQGKIGGIPHSYLSARARNKVVDVVRKRMLEVVFVTAEHRADSRTAEPREKTLHMRGILVPRSRTKNRVVEKRNAPPRHCSIQRRKSEVQKLP